MLTIWKYPLLVTDEQTIEVPYEARFLTVQKQDKQPVLWALVDPKNHKISKTIHIFGTGHEIPRDIGSYISTFQMHEGMLIFHVFEGV